MRTVNLFLVIIVFYLLAAPASAQPAEEEIMQAAGTVTDGGALNVDGYNSAKSKTAVSRGMIIYCDSCILKLPCTAPLIAMAPTAEIDSEMIIAPPPNAIAKSMIIKPPGNIDPGMLYPKVQRMREKQFFLKPQVHSWNDYQQDLFKKMSTFGYFHKFDHK
jgi:hypothetical protein